ncbi:tRNA 4-thiouridine(8) synthase ThiI [Candidatus Woesearchaeota archaeon]|nr:tRNA 4-thiouridine(8) synthase ThiI [Candidatus Woesearchaeota archaeon]
MSSEKGQVTVGQATIVVHHAEITLKGKNRNFFEHKLEENINEGMRNNLISGGFARQESRIVGTIASADIEKAKHVLTTMPGIRYIGVGKQTRPEEQAILDAAHEFFRTRSGKRVSLNTKRSWKEFPTKSPELNRKMGEIAKQCGVAIDFEYPDVTLTIEITSKAAYLYHERIEGPGGLPVGVSGKVLCLFSGGIDSPAAAWLMMKRGCTVDLLHVHPFSTNSEVAGTKIEQLAKLLSTYQSSLKLYVLSYTMYDLVTQGKLDQDASLVSFRNIMLRVADELARKNKYRAIVTGDSIAQVASQTLHNLAAAQDGIRTPILRPVITYDKEEIVRLAKHIGTYDESIKPYKDCCSIVAGKANIATRKEHIRKNLEKVDADSLISNLLQEISVIKVGKEEQELEQVKE